MKKHNRELFANAWRIARAFWFSEERWKAWGLLLAIIGLNLGIVYIHVLLNHWRGTFYNVLQDYNQAGFMKSLADFSVLAGMFILVAGYQIYLQMMLSIRWRRWMTERYVNQWLHNQTYYRMSLLTGNSADNPDQRISEDINLFVSHTLTLSLGLLREVVTLVSFFTILWQLSGVLTVPLGQQQITIPGYLVWAAILYSAFGTWLTVKMGHSLVNLNFFQQRYEADFRFSLMRLRENTESVAMYNGENKEKANFMDRFGRVVENYWKIMIMNKRLMWLTSGYSQVAIIFPILVASPRYFLRQISLGQLFQIASAYDKVHSALSFIVESFTRIAEWRAVVNRLNQFLVNMQVSELMQENKSFTFSRGNQPALEAADVVVRRPDGHVLLENLCLQLAPGDSMLVVGPSGSGKSTLLRTMAGIWPFAGGNIVLPEGQRVMFLPQKSYMPLNTLREVLFYPGAVPSAPDEEIKSLLAACDLGNLADKLDQAEDWGQILSLGEQQRIAFVRAFLEKPDWLFLDEATSALDEAAERRIYGMIRDRLPGTAIVSVGHRSALANYHRLKLEFQGAGKWTLTELPSM